MKKLLCLLTLFCVVTTLALIPLRAEANLIANGWVATSLNAQQCMQTGEMALRSNGYTSIDIDQQLFMVRGQQGQYHGYVRCIPDHGVLILMVSGPDRAVSDNLWEQLRARF